MFQLICLLLSVWLANGQNSSPVSVAEAASGKSVVPNPNQLTTLFGKPIGDATNVLTAGHKGPILLQDTQFIEDISHFNRERIPERVVHAKGAGAFGTFTVTNLITNYTKASVFAFVGKRTDVAVRFSTEGGEQGSADTVLGDNRGFAVKFYTDEGNYDLVGLNIPVFSIRDPFQFVALSHTNKRNPQSGLKDPNAFTDFVSLRPETLNLITYVFGENGIPNGYRFMPGFGINAFKLVNSQGQHVYAKFHWITNQGIQNLNLTTAFTLAGTNPDYARQDLFQAIQAGNFPSWTLKIQVITEAQAQNFTFNPFDATKYWPIEQFPLIEVGVMTLNRNPNNFFADVEEAAYCPANLVPGIEASPDILLQGRLFAYGDTQRYRLGANFQLLPVNQAKAFTNAITQRDGQARSDGNLGQTVNYFPNSFSNSTTDPKFLDSNFTIPESVVFRYEDKDDDNYSQPREQFNALTPAQQQNLVTNLALAVAGIDPAVVQRALAQLAIVDPRYSAGVIAVVEALAAGQQPG